MNNLMYHLKIKSGNFSFLTYISLQTKGNNYRCLTKGAENGHLQAERRALEDILVNTPDCLFAISFGETFHTLHQSLSSSVFLENRVFFSVALFGGMVSIFHAFLDDNGHLTSVNGVRYLSLLQNTV